MAVPGNEEAEGDVGAAVRDGEGDGGVEVGEGAVEEAEGVEGVGGAEVGGRKGGEGERQGGGGREVEERCRWGCQLIRSERLGNRDVPRAVTSKAP